MAVNNRRRPTPPLSQRIQEKIEEAEFFLDKIEELENTNSDHATKTLRHLRFYTSAFLNAARSPQHYMLSAWQRPDPANQRRTVTDPAIRVWYDNAVGMKPDLKFLKSERDQNTHAEPSAPFACFVHTGIILRDGPEIPPTDWVFQEFPELGERSSVFFRRSIQSVKELVEEANLEGHMV